ncbi:uncharacterized protein LOC113339922 [Papaver somniferum]|uniref:uncharacterized protein LOC113339922 n=1 Tax=Papaver somniferum TaxID=3469 RepID=UPI000E6F6F65|nr:uncharacterized protein LOC113339922 [Papaver somniferum]
MVSPRQIGLCENLIGMISPIVPCVNRRMSVGMSIPLFWKVLMFLVKKLNKKANKDASQASTSHNNEIRVGDADRANDEVSLPKGGVPSKTNGKGMKDLAKKSKFSSPTLPDTCSRDDALFSPEISSPVSHMEQLSGIFCNSLTSLADEELTHTCGSIKNVRKCR